MVYELVIFVYLQSLDLMLANGIKT